MATVLPFLVMISHMYVQESNPLDYIRSIIQEKGYFEQWIDCSQFTNALPESTRDLESMSQFRKCVSSNQFGCAC